MWIERHKEPQKNFHFHTEKHDVMIYTPGDKEKDSFGALVHLLRQVGWD